MLLLLLFRLINPYSVSCPSLECLLSHVRSSLLEGSVIMGFESLSFSQRTLHRACSPRTCILLWDQKGKPHDFPFACLEIAPSKDFSAFLSLHLFQILQIPLCSHAQNFSRWSSERKNMLWCSIPSYILHLPTLEVFFFHILLSSKFTCIDIFLWSGDPQPQFFIHSSLKYKLVTPQTNSAGKYSYTLSDECWGLT